MTPPRDGGDAIWKASCSSIALTAELGALDLDQRELSLPTAYAPAVSLRNRS
jgi:hypothetical protein